MKTALVAGGAGFMGSHLCKKLLDKNFRVICLDNLVTGNDGVIKKFLSAKNFKFLKANVSDSKDLKNLNDVSFIFHLASPASPSQKSPRSYLAFPIETLLANSLGTYNLLNIAKNSNAKFLYASSSEVYGDPKVSPQGEDYFGNVNPVGIRSVYDEGKRFGEAITMAYVRKFNTDARIIRIFNTFGPNMRNDDGRVISNFINQAIRNEPLTVYGDGKQTRSVCYIDDLIEGLLLSMFSDKTKGEVINLGNSEEKTIIELANLIKKLTNSNSEIIFEPLPDDDPKQRKPNIEKAKRLLSWKPKVDIDQGLLETIEYFEKIKNS